MNITKIKLVTGGLKGAEITYIKPEEKGTRTLFNEHLEKRKHPIHIRLESLFKDLRIHLLQVCDIVSPQTDKHDVVGLLQETEVRAIKIVGESFIIYGAKNVFDGKVFKLETPVLDADDDYEYYEEVVKIVEQIIEEALLYMRGEVKVTNEELDIRWLQAGKVKDVTLDAFNAMSAEEKLEFHISQIEKKYGGSVLLPEDIDTSKMETEEIVLDKQETVVPETKLRKVSH